MHKVNMVKVTTSITHRTPDCVTEVRVGNTTLTVSGYFKQSATKTAADKMAKVIAAGTSGINVDKMGVS